MQRISYAQLSIVLVVCAFIGRPASGQISALGPRFESEVLEVSQDAPQPASIVRKEGPGASIIATFTGMTLSALLRLAYGLQPQEFVLPPTTLRLNGTVQYPAAKASEFPVMLQNLLTERLGMKSHWVPRDIDAYVLEVAKGGIRMKASDAKIKRNCNYSKSGATQIMRCTGINADDFRQTLVGFIDEGAFAYPFLNRTALEGSYDFSLEYTPKSEALKGAAGPSIYEALQQQLGLTLTRRLQTTQVLIVDYVEATPR